MTKEFEHDPQVTQTPETNRFLENLNQNTNEFLKRNQDLGLWAKKMLTLRAREFARLDYFYHIPTTDFLWDEPDEYNEDSGKSGLVVHVEEDSENGLTKGGVVMTPDGVLWKGTANDGLSGETFSFGFKDAKEVPLEDYPKYFDEAVETMKYITDKKTGIHAAEFRKEQAERLAEHIQQIKDDNQKYGIEGAEFTGDSKTVVKAKEFMQRIADMRKMVAQGDRGIMTEQLENLLGHIFAVEEYLDAEKGGYIYGAQELIFMAGALISSKDKYIGADLYALVIDMWINAPSSSGYLVRRANKVPYRENPESEKIYNIMTEHMINRHREGEKFGSIPMFEQPPAEIVTDKYGTVLSDEIVDWLLNAPVEEPTSL